MRAEPGSGPQSCQRRHAQPFAPRQRAKVGFEQEHPHTSISRCLRFKYFKYFNLSNLSGAARPKKKYFKYSESDMIQKFGEALLESSQ